MFLFINGKTFSHTGLVIFKYISCSYLSGKENYGRGYVSDLNTSHVLIYPTNSLINVSCFAYLNTSHVLIYRFSLEVLVLLQEFKYISCSYLS